MPLTLEDIAAMMNSNKEEILNKVDGLVEEVKEVKTQVKGLTERADSQDETNAIVNEKIKHLQSQISDLKKTPRPSYAQVTVTETQEPKINFEQPEVVTASTHFKKLLSDGKRVIGLSPIDQNDIDIEKDKGVENEDEAMISAAMTFFTEDMNIPTSTLNKMKIIRVFKPATVEDTDRIYVEFENEMSVKIVNRYRRNLAAGL